MLESRTDRFDRRDALALAGSEQNRLLEDIGLNLDVRVEGDPLKHAMDEASEANAPRSVRLERRRSLQHRGSRWQFFVAGSASHSGSGSYSQRSALA